jgi:uncharacterized membrane protein
MVQDEVNQAEWRNQTNWSGPAWFSVYFSKKDSRTWVPKRIPAMGWTINLGRPAGVFWLAGVVVGLPAAIIVAMMALRP